MFLLSLYKLIRKIINILVKCPLEKVNILKWHVNMVRVLKTDLFPFLFTKSTHPMTDELCDTDPSSPAASGLREGC